MEKRLLQNQIGNRNESVLIQVEESGPIREQAALAVLSACGIPPSLVSEKAEGTGQREGFRRFLNLTLMPLGAIVASELSEKLDVPVEA